MRFPDALLMTIRDRASIAAYAGRKLSWDMRKSQPARGDYWACCPFHGEKTPSFHVLDQRGTFKCFGCGEAGDIFTLAQKLEGLSFPEAVERFARETGVSLPEKERADPAAEDRRKRLFALMARAQSLYAEALAGPEGAEARAYLVGRGLGEAVWAGFGLGFAPAARGWASQRLTREGYTREELTACGLARMDDQGALKDFFWGRVMFPIADAQGRVIAFGGRVLGQGEPKYLNSPETEIFQKGRSLYRLKEAREAAARAKAPGLVVAEGYLDVIACELAGIGAVAPLGTALTADQLDLAWRSGGRPVLCFDGDAAGRRAADKALDLALPHFAPSRTVKIALLPDGKDPFDLWRAEGRDGLVSLLETARPAVDALFERERAVEPLTTPEARAGLKERLKAAAGRIGHEETRREYLRELLSRADALTRPPRDPAWRPSQGRPGAKGRFAPGSAAPTPELKAAIGRRGVEGVEGALRTAIDLPRVLDRGFEALSALPVADPELDAIRNAVLRLNTDAQTIDRDTVSRHLRAEGEERAAGRIQRWPPPAIAAAGADLRSDELEAIEAQWMAMLTLDLARPSLEAELAAARQRGDLDDSDAFAAAQALVASKIAVERRARSANDPTASDGAP